MTISKSIYILASSIILFSSLVSALDVSVWQGQYYTGTTFNTGTYEFNFSVYDASIGGDICYSNTTNLTTGSFGEWKTEQIGVGYDCSNSNSDYWLSIDIGGSEQGPRRLLNSFKNLRKDTSTLAPSYNLSGFTRWSIQNTNSDNISGTLFSVMNDVGNTLTLTMTSSNYFSTENNISFNNQPSIGQSSFNEMYFVNGRYTGFSWLNNPFNDTSNIVQTIMNLDESGNLNVSGNITADDTGFFSFLGSLTNRITKLFVESININDSIIFEGDDTYTIKTTNDNDTLRIFSGSKLNYAPKVKLVGISSSTTPGDVVIESGNISGAKIRLRTGEGSSENRIVIQSDGDIILADLNGTGNDYLCIASNGRLFRSDTAC